MLVKTITGNNSHLKLYYLQAGYSAIIYGWLNVGGIQDSLGEVLELMHENGFVFLVLSETRSG